MRKARNQGRVFVTDGSYPNALAAIRALGSAGFEVTVGEREGLPPAEIVGFWSRYCAHRVRYPDPRRNPDAAAAFLTDYVRQQRFDAAIPIGLDMTRLFVQSAQGLAGKTLLPPPESFRVAADKRLTFPHCSAIGIHVPRSLSGAQWPEIGLPVVFKHHSSGAVIARTSAEARAAAERLGAHFDDYLAQEYIPGENGFGYFGFFQDGRERGYFMHERLVQIPKEGGPSVVARAIKDDRLHELGRRTLESLNWNGVAMVEFKRSDLDGKLYLMEINPKFWGSLDLAIQSGVNFPVWTARAIMSGALPDAKEYDIGLKYQWIVPNGLKCFLRYPECRAPFLRNLITPAVKKDVRLGDPLPSAAGLMAMALNWSKR
jgi:predicted ATP-grasp superfamily ATP-dependent carboligase